jgi:hypothetical protein
MVNYGESCTRFFTYQSVVDKMPCGKVGYFVNDIVGLR